VVWEVVSVHDGDSPSVTLRYVSPDGDQGYPGTLTATATYALNDRNELSVDYRATTDKPTVVNISNHGYWNMAGEGSAAGAMGNLLTIPADEFSPTDATAIPTGEFRPVEGTVFDFRTPTAVGLRVRDASDEQIVFGRGYDHNWVISRERAAEPRVIATLEDPVSGRTMEVISDQPGLQFYSGNFMDGTIVGKSGRLYRQGDSIVLEPQAFPDTPNRPEFGSVRLDPGQQYRNFMVFRFTARPAR
jgi:aldose 1-epimerase